MRTVFDHEMLDINWLFGKPTQAIDAIAILRRLWGAEGKADRAWVAETSRQVAPDMAQERRNLEIIDNIIRRTTQQKQDADKTLDYEIEISMDKVARIKSNVWDYYVSNLSEEQRAALADAEK